jgi:hypothetical protein
VAVDVSASVATSDVPSVNVKRHNVSEAQHIVGHEVGNGLQS